MVYGQKHKSKCWFAIRQDCDITTVRVGALVVIPLEEVADAYVSIHQQFEHLQRQILPYLNAVYANLGKLHNHFFFNFSTGSTVLISLVKF